MNNITLIGRTTKDPELSFIQTTGTAVCRFNLAVKRVRSKKEETDFIPVVVMGTKAENTANFVVKGQQVGIIGSLQTGSYIDKDGNKKNTFEVFANEVQFLEKKPVNESKDSNKNKASDKK